MHGARIRNTYEEKEVCRWESTEAEASVQQRAARRWVGDQAVELQISSLQEALLHMQEIRVRTQTSTTRLQARLCCSRFEVMTGGESAACVPRGCCSYSAGKRRT